MTCKGVFISWIILQLCWQQADRSAAPQPAQSLAASPQNWLKLVSSLPLRFTGSLLERLSFLGHSWLNPCPHARLSSLQLKNQTTAQKQKKNLLQQSQQQITVNSQNLANYLTWAQVCNGCCYVGWQQCGKLALYPWCIVLPCDQTSRICCKKWKRRQAP